MWADPCFTIIVFYLNSGIGVLTYFVNTVELMFGRILVPLIIGSLGWGLYGGINNVRRMKPLDDLTASENRIPRKSAIFISTLVLLPGYAAGLYVGFCGW